MRNMVGIIDYGMGNLLSVRHALESLGADTAVLSAPKELAAADRLVLPGVGAFAEGIRRLRETGLAAALDEAVRGRLVRASAGSTARSSAFLRKRRPSGCRTSAGTKHPRGRQAFFSGSCRRAPTSTSFIPIICSAGMPRTSRPCANTASPSPPPCGRRTFSRRSFTRKRVRTTASRFWRIF